MSPYKLFLKCEQEGISLKASIILDMVANYKEIAISAVMDNCLKLGLYSPAMAHRELHWLINNGYVICQESVMDKRAKLCSISRKGKAFLS